MSVRQELDVYDPEFLDRLATHATLHGSMWGDVYPTSLAVAQGMNWEGLGDEAFQTRMMSDTGRAVDSSGTALAAAAAVAAAAGNLYQSTSEARYAVEAVNAAQFTPNDQLDDLKDNLPPSPIPGEAQAREAQRQTLGTAMQDAVRIWQTDRQVAAEAMQGHTVTLQEGTFSDGKPIPLGGGLDTQECQDALKQAEQNRQHMAEWAAGIGLASGAVGGPGTALAGMAGMGALGALWYQYTHKELPGVCR
jgi:hypothetical protein